MDVVREDRVAAAIANAPTCQSAPTPALAEAASAAGEGSRPREQQHREPANTIAGAHVGCRQHREPTRAADRRCDAHHAAPGRARRTVLSTNPSAETQQDPAQFGCRGCCRATTQPTTPAATTSGRPARFPAMLALVREAREGRREAAISATSTEGRGNPSPWRGVAGQDGQGRGLEALRAESVPRTLRPASGPALDEAAGLEEEGGPAPAILACDGWPLDGSRARRRGLPHLPHQERETAPRALVAMTHEVQPRSNAATGSRDWASPEHGDEDRDAEHEAELARHGVDRRAGREALARHRGRRRRWRGSAARSRRRGRRRSGPGTSRRRSRALADAQQPPQAC